MEAVAFDVRGTVAHFRKPDTTATQLTYPFITPTAAKGLIGAILGIEDFITRDMVGIRLLTPVMTVTQQMSMLGKDGYTFNRPTTIELIVQPHYRIYYAGEEHVSRLRSFLENGHAVYPTYLGVAYALTKPVIYKYYDRVEILHEIKEEIETKAIVPTRIIKQVKIEPGRSYCRAGGFMHIYKGGRKFEKSIDFIYEKEGKSIVFLPTEDQQDIKITKLGKEVVCLV